MRWLTEQFGVERLLAAKVLLPTPDFFADPETGTPAAARRMMDKLAAHMGVTRRIRLEVLPDHELPGAAGHYDASERVVIRIAQSQLAAPQPLAATLAHELAHDLLLGGGLLTVDVGDHEWITDLVPVFLGTGLFAANSTVIGNSGYEGGFSWWQMGKQGYLPSRMLGYALALFFFVRGERTPEAAKHLRLDAASALNAGLRFLQKTGDSVFHSDTIRQKRLSPKVGEVMQRLQSRSPTVRLATLWDIGEFGLAEPDLVRPIALRLDDRDPAVQVGAAQALRSLGTLALPAKESLVHVLRSDSDDVQAAAASALATLGDLDRATIVELGTLLASPNLSVASAAALALRANGPLAIPTIPRLLDALARAIKKCDLDATATFAAALAAISLDARACVRKYFAGNEEFEQLATAALAEQLRS